MPVILEPENYELWLDPEFKDLDTLTAMLKPFDPAQMKCYPVSPLVNSPVNDSPECAAQAEPVQSASGTLF
jgi:putative SOS response-associated peptidase YedK